MFHYIKLGKEKSNKNNNSKTGQATDKDIKDFRALRVNKELNTDLGGWVDGKKEIIITKY